MPASISTTHMNTSTIIWDRGGNRQLSSFTLNKKDSTREVLPRLLEQPCTSLSDMAVSLSLVIDLIRYALTSLLFSHVIKEDLL